MSLRDQLEETLAAQSHAITVRNTELYERSGQPFKQRKQAANQALPVFFEKTKAELLKQLNDPERLDGSRRCWLILQQTHPVFPSVERLVALLEDEGLSVELSFFPKDITPATPPPSSGVAVGGMATMLITW